MGIVLVFDLDQTILDSSDDRLFDGSLGPDEIRELIKKNLNMNIVNLLIRTSELRPSGKVTAICLLTNNSSVKFVQLVDGVLKELTKSNGSYGKKAVEDGFEAGEYFFDAIMTRNHSARPIAASGSPPKRIEDINKMLEPFSTSFGSATMDELFFFDDLPNHQILQTYKEVGDFRENYIQIKPPYNKYTRDTTNYTPILRALSELDGGAPTLPEPPPPQQNPSQMAPSMNSAALQALINSAQKKPLGISTPPRSQAPFRGTPALPAKARTVGRNRSNAKLNANNLGLPLPPQMQSIHRPVRSQSPPLSSIFQRKGGSRKTRRRRGGRRFTKRIR
jgi:hypothetical protein